MVLSHFIASSNTRPLWNLHWVPPNFLLNTVSDGILSELGLLSLFFQEISFFPSYPQAGFHTYKCGF